MKLANEWRLGCSVPVPKDLDLLLTRLDRLSLAPGFSLQRQVALRTALQVYFEPGCQTLLSPLPEEIELADLLLFADFYPEDGQLTLIEQLRDVITEHIPEEQRAWMDPLKRSYMDLVEVLSHDSGEARRALRSIGNGRLYEIPAETLGQDVQPGQVSLMRLVREPGDPETSSAVSAGPMLLLSAEDAKALYETTAEERREMEVTGGSFELGEWPEFAKRFGHLLLRNFARMRLAALLAAVGEIRYRTAAETPCFYVLALYEHHEFSSLAAGMNALEGWEEEVPVLPQGAVRPKKLRRWVSRVTEGDSTRIIVARVTVTGTELFLECDKRERLDAVKHTLAAAFGFSLHFRGEATQPPSRRVTQEELATEQPLTLMVTDEEDRVLVGTFLDTVYLEWADRESPALGGRTPRHTATTLEGKERVEALIKEMEQTNLGLLRTGITAFDYDKLRAHVGLC
ncbi:MAG: hypothetical protein OJF47_001000 [Nitrospira sp.]|jgi:hypothetical protein|nr:MAG: hypothetical protein OJF47_001000 [Nitrospira sp.]